MHAACPVGHKFRIEQFRVRYETVLITDPRQPVLGFSLDGFLSRSHSFFRLHCFLVFGLLAALGLALVLYQPKTIIRHYINALLAYIVPGLIYFIWRYQYFGYLLPIPFYAKTGGGIHQYLRGVLYVKSFFFYFVVPPLLLLLGLFFKRDWQWEKLPDSLTACQRHLNASIGLYLCSIVSFTYALSSVYVGGDYMAMYRFFAPILPFIYLLFGPLMSWSFQAIARPMIKKTLAIGLTGSIVLLIAIHSTPIEQSLYL